jgi:preprotein translocase subunit SecG
MESILIVVHLFLAIGLVGLILMQHGKGADMGAAFGSGASASVFGSRGASNFLSRSTAILATLFFVTSLALAYFAMQATEPETLMEGVAPAAVESVAPAVPDAGDLPTIPEAPVVEESAVPEIPVVPAAGEAEVPPVTD